MLAGIVPASFLALLVVWPLATILGRNLAEVGVADAVEIVTSDSNLRVMWFTVWQAACSAAITLAVGLPIAHALARYQFRGRTLVRALTVVPFVLPTVVVAAAFDAVFDRLGIDAQVGGAVPAIVGAHVFFNVAIVVRVVGGQWRLLDPRPTEAARVLGASARRAFVLVTLPRLVPAIASSMVLTFLFSFTSFGVILILGGPSRATLETEIYRFAVLRQQFDVAAVLALVQMLVVVVLALVSAWLQRRAAGAEGRRGRPVAVASFGERLHLGAVLGVVAAVVGAPLAMLIERSLRVGDGYGVDHYLALAEPVQLLPVSPLRSLATSIGFAVVAATIAAVVGVVSGVTIVGGGRFGRALEAAALVPLGVSAVTLGFGYLVTFSAFDLRRSPWLVPLAHAVMGFPFVLASVVPALRSVDDRVRQAAATLGASPRHVFAEIDWPVIRRPALTGAGFAAAISMGEFGATSFLARGSSSFTAPRAIFRLLSQPGSGVRGQALALSVVVGLCVGALATVIELGRDERARAL